MSAPREFRLDVGERMGGREVLAVLPGVGLGQRVRVRCLRCGSERVTKALNLLYGRHCAKCNGHPLSASAARVVAVAQGER